MKSLLTYPIYLFSNLKEQTSNILVDNIENASHVSSMQICMLADNLDMKIT